MRWYIETIIKWLYSLWILNNKFYLPKIVMCSTIKPLATHKENKERISRKWMTHDAETYSENTLGFLFLSFIIDIILVHICFRRKVPAAGSCQPRTENQVSFRIAMSVEQGTRNRIVVVFAVPYHCTVTRPLNCVSKELGFSHSLWWLGNLG